MNRLESFLPNILLGIVVTTIEFGNTLNLGVKLP
jgi:hypothetical protein